jgi:large conductance mechanosensitive channel
MSTVKKNLKKIKANEPAIIKEFKEFINRGNVVDLAVGVIVGGAFSAIVTSLVDNIVTPVLSMVIGGFDLTGLSITVPSFLGATEPATIKYGLFLQNVIDFLITAFVIFIMVRFINKLQEKAKLEEEEKKAEEEAQEDENTALLREIRDLLQKKK